MDLGLSGRSAIVTGGSKGIGKAIAKLLVEEGARVGICARGIDALKDVQAEIQHEDRTVQIFPVDATDPEEVSRVIALAIKEFGGLDILVNNVGGINRFADFDDIKNEEWLDAFKLNVMSMVYFVRYALPWLRKSHAARVINISSISGVQPGYFNPHYTITKAATINLSKYLANRHAVDRILVNAVCPGPVHSHSWNKNIELKALNDGISLEQAQILVENEEASKIPLRCVGEGEDVANIVAFLASDKASWITGACFHVNGGKLHSIS